ncbi:MAG: hypothetical protein ACXVCY_10795 [Pseudobdellovibrionaceae bacterium]
MKRLMFFILALFVTACQGTNGGNNNIAVTPLNLNCINGNAYCNNSYYSQYGNGWAPYPGLYNYPYNYTSYFNQNGFCNCPAGYLPTYNGNYGLGCVNSQLLQPYTGLYTYWQFGLSSTYSAPQTTINYPQFSNVPGGYSSGLQCAGTLTQSCILSQVNSCGAGATCRQVIAGSDLGVCVRY